MATVFHKILDGRFVEIKHNHRRQKLQNKKTPILLEAVLAMETM